MKEEYIRIMNEKIASGEIDDRDLREHYFEQEVEIPEEIRCLYGFKGVSYNIDCCHCEKQSVCKFKETLIK